MCFSGRSQVVDGLFLQYKVVLRGLRFRSHLLNSNGLNALAFLGSSRLKGSAAQLNVASERFVSSIGRNVRRKGALSGFLKAAQLFLLLIFAALLALLILSFVAPLPTPKKLAVPQKVAVPSLAPGAIINPFGDAPITLDATEAVDTGPDLQETQLNLVLHGTWIDETGGTAVIKTPDDKQGRFAIGEEIWDEVILEEVYRTQVTIVRAGVRESLRLINSKPSTGQQVRVTAEDVLKNRPAGPPVGQEGIGLIGDQVMVMAEPDGEGGKRFVIFPASDEKVFEDLGFRAGDILVGVGDLWVGTDAALAITSLAALIDQPSVDIKVERDGVILPLTVSLASAVEGFEDE